MATYFDVEFEYVPYAPNNHIVPALLSQHGKFIVG